MIEVYLVLNAGVPPTWSVEALNTDGDGGAEIAIFSGLCSEQRAREYATWKYGIQKPKIFAV